MPFGLVFGNERPCHGFEHAARSQRALGRAGADLQRGQDLLVDRADRRQRRGLDVVDAVDAHDLFDQIGLAVDIRTPGRHRDGDPVAGTRNLETEAGEDAGGFLVGDRKPGQAPDFGEGEIDHLLLMTLVAFNAG